MWQRIISRLRNFFGFSRTEANGFIILLLLMVLILFAPLLTKQVFLQMQPDLLLASDVRKLDSLLRVMDENVIIKNEEAAISNESLLYDFDLNTVTSAELQSFGLPEFLADRVLKYREKVKPFTSSSELLKVYGMDSTLYLTLKPFIKIKALPESGKNRSESYYHSSVDRDTLYSRNKKNFSKSFKSQLIPFDINQADTAQLKKIYGIGAVYAQRIVDYRDLLGGFVRQDQFNEIYGLKSPNLDSLKIYAKVNPPLKVKKLKLNSITEKELANHPYISYQQAKLIIAYRDMHGDYNSAAELLNVKVLDSTFIEKVEEYLSFEAR
ncbi:hypothetical protein C9994_06345 [Marivirga lumbricoides]|uniref:Competence protein ComEA n=1 Tax=Marivirga lumbricoides TaxID=1046115 RepID=A0A2T4DS63_9BACT|nr:hypothetical protein C9994_06345 [Marivirga lumbricoides]